MERDLLMKNWQLLSDRLMKERNSRGFWDGYLSSSALSTAIGVVTLKKSGIPGYEKQIEKGYSWLFSHIHQDGGYGDTPSGESNVSTTLLSYAAIYSHPDSPARTAALRSIEEYLAARKMELIPGEIIFTILNYYGKDYSFSVPILAMLTICGVIDRSAIDKIPQLPFELSLLPPSLYRLFNLQVVSYAIPALIAVGIFTHRQRRKGFAGIRSVRNLLVHPAIRKLQALLPESGGFLEAIPLTGFVGLCLIAGGMQENEVVKRGLRFLEMQQRADGSWPIDTNLSTWVTTLSIRALRSSGAYKFTESDTTMWRNHLLSLQYTERHPFNQARPGGWGWTHFSGSVPDGDDTPGALLALLQLYEGSIPEISALIRGSEWLLGIQNPDGGFPTFCKGWTDLPFDSSCPDLTGHALLAFATLMGKAGSHIPETIRSKLINSFRKAVRYLQEHQDTSGFWIPLWFGNQLTSTRKNYVYGTARIAVYLQDCLGAGILEGQPEELIRSMVVSAEKFLTSQQNADGSWGGEKGIPGSIEETALAIAALVQTNPEACLRGFAWLENHSGGDRLKASPIGLYFATLWYDEKMYPMVFYLEALGRYLTRYNATPS
jgi:squalene-hopene/tetraprenyl-beta-curcumene cyclase